MSFFKSRRPPAFFVTASSFADLRTIELSIEMNLQEERGSFARAAAQKQIEGIASELFRYPARFEMRNRPEAAGYTQPFVIEITGIHDTTWADYFEPDSVAWTLNAYGVLTALRLAHQRHPSPYPFRVKFGPGHQLPERGDSAWDDLSESG